ncbi:amino acid ABC transporter substrate-binding protein [Desulfohalobiaceae bacterium Ax17]|uniref:amino acid ABC transporter substrate-binding protein n=1 Tax=Desulfovulcanus ferrireducens TaxID=2831190 RepID=UPI00207B9A54|nr:amino acid ABC transporter substrate-binding protein [Desulfovulcanus ferrireducens]
MKKILVTLGCLALLISFSSLSFAKDVIKLGCAISFTGKKSRSGKLYVDAYNLAVEEINKKGGIEIGGKRYKLEIIYYDDKSEATESSRLVEKLISEDKVDFLLGPYSSGITIPDSLVARRYRVPMVEGGGASGKIFSRGNKYIFGLLPAAGEYFKSTLEFLKTVNPVPKTIAILFADDKFDVSVAKGTKKIAEKMGYEVVIYEKYAEGTSDFTSVLTKIKAKNPDVVLVAGHTEESLNFTQQAKELDVNPKMISLTVGPSEADFRKALGKDANYIYGVASWSTQMNFKGYIFKDTKEFIKIFEKKFGYEPDYHNAAGIACVAVIKNAIERAGTLDREKVREMIASTKLDTIYGRVEFNPNGQIKGTSVVLQILDNSVYEVYPHEYKKPVYPIPKWKER